MKFIKDAPAAPYPRGYKPTYITWTSGKYPKGPGYRIVCYIGFTSALERGWQRIYFAYYQSRRVAPKTSGYRTLKEAKAACTQHQKISLKYKYLKLIKYSILHQLFPLL